jgi:undecaprenyl-diphosphatase
MRNEWIWFPFYIFIIAFSIFNFGKNSYWFILYCFLNFGTTDIISSHLIKKNVERLRPCRDESIINKNVLVRCGSGYSFTSSHATNHFGLATFLSFTLGIFIKKIRMPLFIWAAIISFSQVYVGVHFPLDIFIGAIVGISIGRIWSWIFMKYYPDKLILT